MDLLVLLMWTFTYWAAPAAVLLSWLLARKLHGAARLRSLLAVNLSLSLLLLFPMVTSAGFLGEFDVPWYLTLSGPDRPQIAWPVLCMLSLASLVTTALTATVARR